MIVVFLGVDAVICFAFVVYKQRHSDPRFFALDTLCIVRIHWEPGNQVPTNFISSSEFFGRIHALS